MACPSRWDTPISDNHKAQMLLTPLTLSNSAEPYPNPSSTCPKAQAPPTTPVTYPCPFPLPRCPTTRSPQREGHLWVCALSPGPHQYGHYSVQAALTPPSRPVGRRRWQSGSLGPRCRSPTLSSVTAWPALVLATASPPRSSKGV